LDYNKILSNMPNFFQINDWKFKDFLKIIIIINITFLALVLIEEFIFEVFFLRQFFGFIYLVLLPGYIILRILRLHDLGIIKSSFFSIGISIAYIALIGILINIFLPFIGINSPLSFVPIFSLTLISFFILIVIAYFRDKDFSNYSVINLKGLFSPIIFTILLFPILSILGVLLINLFENNFTLLFLNLLVCITFTIVIFYKKILPEKYYPLFIWAISISFILQLTLISKNLIGSDIHLEFYLFKLTENAGLWDTSIPMTVNSMAIISVVPVFFSKLLNIDGIWVFKLIYPIIFSLVPVALYQVYKAQTNTNIALLASFFFMGFHKFQEMMYTNARQGIAEFFIVLIFLLIFKKELMSVSERFLFVFFSLGLVVSHYGSTYVFIIFLLFIWLSLLINRNTIRKIKESTIVTFFVIVLSYYIYSSQSINFKSIVFTFKGLFMNIYNNFLDPSVRDPIAIQAIGIGIFDQMYFFHIMGKIIFYITMIFIVIGVIILFFKKDNFNFLKEFKPTAYISLLLLVSSVIVPSISTTLGMKRIYHLALLVLSPICIIGSIGIYNKFLKFIEKSSKYIIILKPSYKKIIKNKKTFFNLLIILLLCLYFLFNTGFMMEISNEPSLGSISLNYDERKYELFQENDVKGLKFLSEKKGNSFTICFSPQRWRFVLYNGIDFDDVKASFLPKNQYRYLFLRWGEKEVGEMVFSKNYSFNYVDINDCSFFELENKIYNSGSEIYFIPRP